MPSYARDDEVMYHIGLSRQMTQGAEYVLLPGDPGRVEGLAKALDKKAVPLAFHREYKSFLARVKKRPVLVMSSGMGGPAVSIGVEEMARIGVKNFIRIGTTGSIQEDLELGDLVISRAAVRLDGASKAYAPIEYPAAADLDITVALKKAAEELKVPHKVGITISTDSFWQGQERYDSFTGYVPRHLQGSLKEWQRLNCTNYEMEAATLFTLANAFGLRAGAVCGVVAKRTDSEAVAPPDIYKTAEKRFQKVAKRAIELLMAQDSAKG